MYLPRAYIHQNRFRAAVEKVAKDFAPQVASVDISFEDDWTGEPAVMLMVMLDDSTAPFDDLLKIGRDFRKAVWDRMEPMARWGVFIYFRYRTLAEQARLDQARA